MKSNIEKFNALVSEEKSTLLEKLKFRKENKYWLNTSSNISFKVLSKLRSNKKQGLKPSTQKELANSLGVTPQYVNKLVKGSENLTLETICKIENILGFDILLKEQTKEIVYKIKFTNNAKVNSLKTPTKNTKIIKLNTNIASSNKPHYLTANG